MKRAHRRRCNSHLLRTRRVALIAAMILTDDPSAAWDRRARLTAGVLGLGAFLTQFDVTALVVVMPAIGRDLGLGMPVLAWVVDAYSLAFTAALLAAGALADRHGRRRILLVGNGCSPPRPSPAPSPGPRSPCASPAPRRVSARPS